MTVPAPAPAADPPASRWLRALLVLAGLLIPQLILYWPSVVGRTIPLPLDILEQPSIYSPKPADGQWKWADDIYLSDLVQVVEVNRRYAADEVRAGRLPLWSPYNYAGSPFLAANHTALFSPYRLIDYLWPEPQTLVWNLILQSLVGGLGAFLFFRRAMGVGFLPAAIGCWLFPHIGFLVQWTGFTISTVASLLPWVLLAVDAAVRRPGGFGGIGLAIAVAVLLTSGHSANAAHVLLASGLYMLWRLVDRHTLRGLVSSAAAASIGATVAGWAIGFLLAAPQILPTIDYMQRSNRIAMRVAGHVETNPQGIAAALQLAMPHVYGMGRRHSPYLLTSNRLEGMPCGYAGMVSLVVLAPLAWRWRARRGMAWFWLALGVVAAMPLLGVLGADRLFHLPGLNQLRNNRFVLMSAWSILALAVMGLEALRGERKNWRRWMWALVGVAVALVGYNVVRARQPAPRLAEIEALVMQRTAVADRAAEAARFAAAQVWFAQMHWWYAGAALVCVALLLLLRSERLHGGALLATLGVVALVEVTANAWNVAAQHDAASYFPRIPALAVVAATNDGRAAGIGCCPPSMNLMHRLREIRGYDAADPMRMVELLMLFGAPNAGRSPSYAVTQNFVPDVRSPLLDMLNVKYLVTRRPAASNQYVQLLLDDGDYRVLENVGWLPRVWVPAAAKVVNDKQQRLALLTDPTFSPPDLAYVESDTPLEISGASGSATIAAETGNSLSIDLDMRTDGVVVVSEAWDPGWKAWVDGEEVEVMPANHALRAVRVGAGAKRLEMRYEPRSFTVSLWLAALAAGILALWSLTVWRGGRRAAPA